jgi:tetratricopeptide (TPR) repeat protein
MLKSRLPPGRTALASESPVRLPPEPGPAAEAVAVFEEGMAALQRHDYRAAARRFEAILTRFDSERALGDRSRVYLALCQRELARQPVAPRTVEERLTAATAALNNDDDVEAETYVRAVLDEAPHHELALYLLAAIEARRGAHESALTLLTRAVDVSPEIRAQVRHDLDFETLRDMDAFRQLLEAPVVRHSQARAGQPRGRRVRAER